MNLRSSQWFSSEDREISFQNRSALRSMGHVPESFLGKPIIGIANSWSDYNNCNYPHKQLVEQVKRGVLLAGGYPMEFHTITVSSDLNKPSDLLYRNLMAMDVEECVRSLPMDGVVLLGECDKTIPAQLMAAASCDIPAIQLAAGHRSSSTFKGKRVNYGTDFWTYMEDYQAGKINDSELDELEACMSCSTGGCSVMGTASTMKSLSEIMGMMLPGTSSIPAGHVKRMHAAEATGKRIVDMVREDLRPSKLMTPAAFQNATKLLAAIGGAANALIHLTAIAGRLGIKIPLQEYATLTRDVPLLVNLQPAGIHDMDTFFAAGGLGAAIQNLLPMLDTGCLSAAGKSIEETYKYDTALIPEVIYTVDAPFKEDAGYVILTGNLSPNGAVIKKALCSKRLLTHRGRAVVFNDYQDMMNRIHSDDLEVDEDSVLILRNVGPVGIGAPEWGMLPIPNKLLKKGVRDMVRISDARMSGTSFGTIVLHVSPEAAIGGPLAIVQDGDMIELDVEKGSLNVLLDDAEIAERLKGWEKPASPHVRGYLRLFQDTVLQYEEGCDFSFARPNSPEEAKFVHPYVGKA